MKHYLQLIFRHLQMLLKLSYRVFYGGLFFISTILSGCGTTGEQELPAAPATATSGWSAQAEPRFARGFDISYTDDYKVLHLFQEQDTTRYLLLPRGAARPEAYPQAQVIRIPISKLVALSTTHVALADFVRADSILTGLDNTRYVYDPEVRERIASGEIAEVGEGGSLNQEMVIALQPDLLMVSGMPGTDLQKYQAIISSGIPVLINTEWMESSPLGKAEWVKLMAALTNGEAIANKKFDSLTAEYLRLARLTSRFKNRPSVISGSPFQGAWYVPGGKSYRASLYEDAGAHWPWAQDTAAVSIPVAFENMYACGLEAEYWLNPGMVNSLQELRAKDERFADFKSFKTAQVYNNNRRMTADGQGNDYFESGVVNPHLILADLTYILHPELLPQHTLQYYRKLE